MKIGKNGGVVIGAVGKNNLLVQLIGTSGDFCTMVLICFYCYRAFDYYRVMLL